MDIIAHANCRPSPVAMTQDMPCLFEAKSRASYLFMQEFNMMSMFLYVFLFFSGQGKCSLSTSTSFQEPAMEAMYEMREFSKLSFKTTYSIFKFKEYPYKKCNQQHSCPWELILEI